MTSEAAIRTNYIFVDYENIQELDLDLIAGKPVKVFLIVGQRRTKLPSLLARQIHKYHDQVAWIESQGASPNALDLVLAYHVGLQAKADPKGYFHILAKDKDYDALIQHLRTNSILARRAEALAKIPALIDIPHLSHDQQVQWVVECLKKNEMTRPRRKPQLLNTINALCRKQLREEELQKIITTMETKKLIALTLQGGVSYHL